MKIAEVISTGPYAWSTGGPARVVYDLSKELVKRGHTMTILTTDVYQAEERWPTNGDTEYVDGIEVIRFRNISNLLAWKHHLSISPSIAGYLRSHLKEYDLVHLQDLVSLMALETARYCGKCNSPYVFSAHGSIPWLNEKKIVNWLYAKSSGNKIVKNASKVFALTETEVEQYKSIGVNEDKIEIVPNGVDLAEFNDLPPRGNFRKRYGLDDSQQIVLYLGRIHQTKGIDLLTRAFADISREIASFRLVIIGPDDGYLLVLKKLIKELNIEEKVIIVGPLYNREKVEAYIDADVFVTPSFYGFPVTFLEACASGTSIVTTNKGDQLDWLNGQIGFTVPYEENQLGRAIMRILENDGLRKTFGERGKLLVKERFNWSEIAKQVESIYLSVR
jgi:glycosyltransferase involved in cell wall biosynthesis